jgi:hypothetical protein
VIFLQPLYMGVELSSLAVAQKVILDRLLKNAQMQGSRSFEECGPLGYRRTLKDRNDEKRGERRRWVIFSTC